MALDYNFEQTQELNDGMKFGGTIELPFIAPPVWVINGDPRLRAMITIAPAQYFGGWSANFEDMQQAGEEYSLDHFPAGFVEAEMTSRDNKPLKNVVSRTVFVSPFGVRKSWITREKTRYAEYVAGARQHIQVLAMLGSKENGKVLPFYPVLLSAKGWQASHLEKSITTWSSKTSLTRQKLARAANTTDIPAYLFWSAIGTWGTEPKVESVGSGNDKSPITPISAFIPKEITEAQLESLFVGSEVIDEMLDLKRQAKEWLGAWSHLATSGQGTAPAPIPPEDDNFTTPPDIGVTDDIPF